MIRLRQDYGGQANNLLSWAKKLLTARIHIEPVFANATPRQAKCASAFAKATAGQGGVRYIICCLIFTIFKKMLDKI
jgi:hypothetical protein